MAGNPKKILVVEDEPGVQLTLEDRLRSEGYAVDVKSNGIEGQKAILGGGYDMVLLDVMMPGLDGFTVCRNIRKAGIQIPVLMLTARDTNIDTVTGLRVGADDYLAKPFDMQVLLARIEALFRRFERSNKSSADLLSCQILSFGDFRLDLEKGLLERRPPDGETEAVELNAQEYKLLEYLVRNSNKIISRHAILDDVWGYESEITTRTVDVHIAKLRQRLGESERPKHIQTYRGRGYKFDLNP